MNSKFYCTLKAQTSQSNKINLADSFQTNYDDDLLKLLLYHSVIGNNKLLAQSQEVFEIEVDVQQDIAQFYMDIVIIGYDDAAQLCLSTLHQCNNKMFKNCSRC